MSRIWLALLLVAACKKETRPPSLGEALSIEQPGGSNPMPKVEPDRNDPHPACRR